MTAVPSGHTTQVCRILRGGWETPWSVTHVAGLAGLDVSTVRKICARLATAGVLSRVGVLYQWVQGAELPADGRGRHGKHRPVSGVEWAKRRKQRAALQKARAKKAAKKASAAAVDAAGLIVARWM